MWQEIKDRGVHALVSDLSSAEAVELSEKYGTHNYAPIPVNIIKGDGSRVWDSNGKEYIDCIGSYSATAAGHLSPFIVDTIVKQLKEVAVISRSFYNAEVALFLKGLCEFTGLDQACPMNSGAEAIETCIKLARKWGYTKKGVEKDKAEIIVCSDNFHGRTTTIVGFSTEDKYKELFGPYAPGAFKVVPFGDADALEAAITPNTVGFLAEPIQAEGGILVAPDGYFKKVREVCDKHNVLLIWDEIQVGFYRTGPRFAWQYEDAKPDLMAVGKPLGGGIMPVSAAVGQSHVMEVFQPGDHGSTFGGNPLGSVAALAAMSEMETQNYGERSTRLGEMTLNFLRDLPFKEIKEVRGRGLLIGIEFHPEIDFKRFGQTIVENGVLTKQTRRGTFRLTPPITIEEDLLMEALNRFKASIQQVVG